MAILKSFVCNSCHVFSLLTIGPFVIHCPLVEAKILSWANNIQIKGLDGACSWEHVAVDLELTSASRNRLKWGKCTLKSFSNIGISLTICIPFPFYQTKGGPSGSKVLKNGLKNIDLLDDCLTGDFVISRPTACSIYSSAQGESLYKQPIS